MFPLSSGITGPRTFLLTLSDVASSSPFSALSQEFCCILTNAEASTVALMLACTCTSATTHESETRRGSLKSSQCHTFLKFNVSLNVKGCQIHIVVTIVLWSKRIGQVSVVILFSYFAVAQDTFIFI